MPAMDPTLRGSAYVALGAVLFGTSGLFVVALRALPLPEVLALRFLLGALGFGAIVAATRAGRATLRAPRRALPLLAFMGLAMATVDYALYNSILGGAGVALATLLLYTAPVWIVVGSALVLRERPTRREVAGVALGFAGALVVLRPGLEPVSGAVLLGLASGVAWAAWVLASRAAGERGATGEAQALASMGVGSLAVVPYAIARGVVAPSATEWALALGLALLAGGLPLMLTARGLRLVDANRAAVLGYLEPATAVALGAILLSERFDVATAAGCGLILAGAWIVTRAPAAGASRGA